VHPELIAASIRSGIRCEASPSSRLLRLPSGRIAIVLAVARTFDGLFIVNEHSLVALTKASHLHLSSDFLPSGPSIATTAAMDSFLPLGGFQLPFQRRLSRLYNDTKKSSDFLKEPVQNAEDPEIKALHRKLRIQKDRLVSWGLEWSDPGQSSSSAEIDESLSKAGLSEVVGSIMSTIKDILAEAEPLWLSSKRLVSGDKSEKGVGDRKVPLVVWDKGRFEDLLRDLTTSIDTLYDLSRTRSSAAISSQANRERMLKSTSSSQSFRAFESTRMQAPQQIDPSTLSNLASALSEASTETRRQLRSRQVVVMGKQAYSELTKSTGRQWSPLLLEFAPFDAIYSTTGIMPPMARFEKLSAGLQQDPQRSPGAWSGLPRLLGYFEDLEHSRLGLVYHFPPGFHAVSSDQLTHNPLHNVCTLGDLLSRPDFEPRLEAKFRLAHNLANTIFDMHARGITHGNLVDANVSFCNGASAEPGSADIDVDIRRPLVSSFDVFPDTPGEGASDIPLHLYRHPLDPRTTASSPLALTPDSRVLDLYSLAMILLSVGLWTRLDLLAPSRHSPSISEAVLEQLAIRCGSLYMKAVQACWSAVDQELLGDTKSDELLSATQVKVSRYLEACCILDGVSGLEERLTQDQRDDSTVLTVSPTSPVASMSGSSRVTPRTVPDTKKSPIVGAPLPALPQSERMEEVKVFKERKHLLQELGRLALLIVPIAPKASALETKQERSENTKLRLYPHVPLPPDAVEKWNTTIIHEVNHALRHFCRKNPESVEISLESIGVNPLKTQPTVLVVCTSVSKVRAILKKKLGQLFDGTGGLSLKVCRGQVLRSRKDSDKPKRSMAGPDVTDSQEIKDADSESITAANPEFQERPNNGASIGAWIGDRHLPPVSFGGLVIIDDKPYGMTVHHMLDDPEAAYTLFQQPSEQTTTDNKRSQAWYDEEQSDSSETDEYACEFSDSDTQSETDITSDDEYDASDDGHDDEFDFSEPGDIPGIEPGCGDGYIVTQPALDDVQDGFYPSPETEAEDHLDTFSLGEVYASSGIRRRQENGLVHEIDWALFEFNSERQPGENSVPRVDAPSSPSFQGPRSLHPTTIAKTSSLPGLEVQCVARTSGLQTGVILPALTSVKIFGRASPSHTYQVSSAAAAVAAPIGPSLDDKNAKRAPLGIPGDSGAWVVDKVQGQVCGHVLAWSQRKRVAYICPMDVLLLDIAQTLEASEIRLPGGEPVVSIVHEREEKDDVDEDGDEDLEDLIKEELSDEDDDEAPVLSRAAPVRRADSGMGIKGRPAGKAKGGLETRFVEKMENITVRSKGIGVST
jgi:hypothetical protein